MLSQIPEDRVCEFPAKPRAGSVTGVTAKVPAGLCRQTSGTAAALEEVSKCVREMHSFTNELLSWDLVERNGGNGGGGVTGGNAIADGNAGAEADSSGDSDDTVIEEAPAEDPPGALPRHRVDAGDAGVTVAPLPPPLPEMSPRPAAAARDWEEERLTLRALRELGEPPRGTPNPPGDPAEPPPGTQLLPCLAGKTKKSSFFTPKMPPLLLNRPKTSRFGGVCVCVGGLRAAGQPPQKIRGEKARG